MHEAWAKELMFLRYWIHLEWFEFESCMGKRRWLQQCTLFAYIHLEGIVRRGKEANPLLRENSRRSSPVFVGSALLPVTSFVPDSTHLPIAISCTATVQCNSAHSYDWIESDDDDCNGPGVSRVLSLNYRPPCQWLRNVAHKSLVFTRQPRTADKWRFGPLLHLTSVRKSETCPFELLEMLLTPSSIIL